MIRETDRNLKIIDDDTSILVNERNVRWLRDKCVRKKMFVRIRESRENNCNLIFSKNNDITFFAKKNIYFFQDLGRAVSLVFVFFFFFSTFIIINFRNVAKLCERQTLQVAFKRILFLHILFWNLDWQIILTLCYRIIVWVKC